MSFGIDYASPDQNKPPIWSHFQQTGGSFVWLRASFVYYDASHHAWTLAPDPACARDWAGIPSALTRGAYMFPVLNAKQTPEEQVAAFASAIHAAGGLRPGIDFPPSLDIEFPQGIIGTGLDRAGIMVWLRRAIAALKSTFGCWPILYTSARVWDDHDADCLGSPPAADLQDCPLWLARYPYKTRIQAVLPPIDGAPPVPKPWGDQWFAWQCQGDAVGVPGFTSTTDVDEFRVLHPGQHGGHVKWLKRKLVTLPAPMAGPLNAQDDRYDHDLELAVRALQVRHGLVVDGIVGPKTFAAAAWL